MPRVCPGVCSGRIDQLAGSSLAGVDRARGAGTSSRSSGLISTAIPGQRATSSPSVADMVVVVMGEQHLRRRDPQALGGGEQRLDRAAGVDHDGLAARVIADQIGVREVLRVAASVR